MSDPAHPPDPPTLRMRLCRALLRLVGWRLVVDPPPVPKYVAVGAWHTTNWDFPLAILAMGGMGIRLHFVGKRELVDGRLGWVMRRLGVIGVDRDRRTGFTETVAQLFRERDALALVVPAEGTRAATEYWKSGFYYMALAAEVPIAFSFIDARTRTLGIDGAFEPSGVLEDDLQRLRDFYGEKRGIKPENMGPIRFRPRPPLGDTDTEAPGSGGAEDASSRAAEASAGSAETTGER